ncbi:MAG: FAD-dependent oxidoreductase [Longimicrobiales bacterium]
MAEETRQTLPLWSEAELPRYAALQKSRRPLDVDVCVVGAGIAGMMSAYLLAREGLRVAVLEDGEIASGETGRTTAHLSNALDDRYTRLEKVHGADGARLAAASHGEAIRLLEEATSRESIDCDFGRLDGYLFAGPGTDRAFLEREREAARRAGLTGVELVEAPPARLWDGPALRFPDQAQFHPVRFLAGLAIALERLGVLLHTDTFVSAVRENELSVELETRNGGRVVAEWAVIATNSPVTDLIITPSKIEPYRTYVVTFEVSHGSVPAGLYWDTLDPYHYVRLQRGPADTDYLIVGGADERTGEAGNGVLAFAGLERWTRERFPTADTVRYAWSGQVLEPFDHLAFIGRQSGKDRIFVITGDSGHGMTHGALGAALLRDLIAGRPNPWAELYDPGRISMHAAKEYLRGGANVLRHYAERLRGGEVESEDEIAEEAGAVVARDGERLAVYRDQNGKLHRRSAICTHAGCVVHWNATERSWDCPCHGSRFDPFGQVLNGPAGAPLEAP